jgi:tyrosyl-tRNA synthetase
MSKSLGNYVGISEPPREIFGKLMSVSDVLMWRYYDLLSFRGNAEIAQLRKEVAEGRNPRDVKVLLAQEIVARFHGQSAAVDALADFEARFKQGAIPDDVPDVQIEASSAGISIVQVLKQAGLTASTSEAMRMIDQGGVKIDGVKVEDKGLLLGKDSPLVIQVGKRKFARIVFA